MRVELPNFLPRGFWRGFRRLSRRSQCVVGLLSAFGLLVLLVYQLSTPRNSRVHKSFLLTLLLVIGVTLAREFLFPPKGPKNAKPSGLGDFRLPTATEGRPIPLIWGRVLLSGPNVVWYGDLRQEAIQKKQRQGFFSSVTTTVGFRYHLGIQQALCRGPGVKLIRVLIGKKQAFSGAVSSGSHFDIDSDSLLGGDDFGAGGVKATVDFYGGETTQLPNDYLDTVERQRVASAITPTAPRYTGTSYVVIRELTSADPQATDAGAYIGNQTSLQPWAFEVERFPALFAGQSSGDNKIGSFDANPINVAVEYLTNTEWGRGQDASLIGSSFKTAADAMIAENNGYSRVLDQEIPKQDFLRELEDQIDGVIYESRSTGKWEVQLARASNDARFGYDIDTVPQLSVANGVAVKAYDRSTWEATLNQVSVSYAKREDDYKQSFAIAQNLANAIMVGGGTPLTARGVPTTFDFPGCKLSSLASSLAWRELRGRSQPVLRATFEVNREFFALERGFVFAWIDSRLFSGKIAMRVLKIDDGEALGGVMTVEAAEDILSYELASGGDPGATNWIPPVGSLLAYPATQQLAIEAPRGLVVRDPEYAGKAGANKIVCAARRQGDEVAFQIGQRSAAGAPAGTYAPDDDVVQFAAIGQLKANLAAGTAIPTPSLLVSPGPDTQAVLEALFDDTLTLTDLGVDLRQLVLIDDEFMLVSTAALSGLDVDLGDVYRGVLGTPQAAHASGAAVFLVFVGAGITKTTFPAGFNVDIELRPRTATTVLASAVTKISIALTNRALRPYPPAAVFYNGSATRFGAIALEADGAGLNGVGFDVDWHRRAFTATDEVAELLADNSNVAASTEYRVSVYSDPDGANDLVFQGSWAAGNGPITPTQAQVINQAAAGTKLQIRIDARHDIETFTNLENRSPLVHDVVPTSPRTSQVYLGGDLRANQISTSYSVASIGVHTVNIGAAYGTSNVQARINGGAWATIIAAGLTSGTTASLAVSDTIELRHTVNETPDPNFVEITAGGAGVAYGAFSA